VARIDPDEHARRLATASLAADDPTGWFEQLYADAASETSEVPWDRDAPQRLLVQWAQASALRGAGRLAVVVGCGLGADAEYVAALGYATVAFDVSPTAVSLARTAHPGSEVDYICADLLDLPAHWCDAFDLVVESMTVQSMPKAYRPAATRNIARMVAPGGTLLVVASAAPEEEPPGRPDAGPPWPLTRDEVLVFGSDPLQLVALDDLRDTTAPGSRRWRAELVRR